MIIPVVHCFDNNYVIPASVAFLSMLEHANKKHQYKLYIMHSDITLENQKKLTSIVNRFANASLEFIDMNNKFNDLFSNTLCQAHYSKEMYYKLCVASLFKQYDYAIITDVDVLYQDDISKEYEKFIKTTDYYMAGVYTDRLKGTFLETYDNVYDADFNADEKHILLNGVGAGYLIFNLKKIRKDGIEKKLIDFAAKNTYRLIQPEQDTLNLCLYPNIYRLPLSSMVCTYLYDLQVPPPTKDNFRVKKALQKPVQIHFATCIKPWNMPSCTKADLWYAYLSKTPFFYEQMQSLEKKETMQKEIWRLFGLPVLSVKSKKNSVSKIKLFGIKLKKST